MEGSLEKHGKSFEKRVRFNLVSFEDLEDEEKADVTAARQAQKESVDPKYRVGAVMRNFQGDVSVVHNEGQTGHAEQNALRKLYASIEPPHEKKIKSLVIVGARKGEEVVRRDTPYPDEITYEDIEWMKPCAKCLEYIHDRSANVEDIKILSVAASGEIMRTSLRSLLPSPHTSFQLPLDANTLTPLKEFHESHTETAKYLAEQNGSLRKKIQDILKKSSED